MRWFRFYTDVVDDAKMRKLEHDEYRIFTYLLAVACEDEREGIFSNDVADLAWRLRFPQDLIQRTLDKLQELKIVGQNGDGWKFLNWESRQFRSDRSAKERMRNYRERQKRNRTIDNVTSPLRNCYSDVDVLEQSRAEQSIRVSKDTLVVSKADSDSLKGESDPCPHQKIIDLYHEVLPELPRVKNWTKKRRGYLSARWREDPKHQTLDYWKKFFEHVRRCPFLMGNRDGPRFDLEWLVREGNFVKVIEGKYLSREVAQ